MGIVLPADFDSALDSGTVKLKAYIWGESLAKNRLIIPTALADAVHELSGAELPVTIETVALGDESSLPWTDRLLPLIVLLAIFFGGMMIPASSLIKEKKPPYAGGFKCQSGFYRGNILRQRHYRSSYRHINGCAHSDS